MVECVACDFANCSLCDICKYCIAKLGEQRATYPRGAIYQRFKLLTKRNLPLQDSQPAIATPATVQTVADAVIGTFKESTMSLKRNGTWTVVIYME